MALSDHFRPDLFRPRNLVPAGIAVVVVAGTWFAVRGMQPDASQMVAPAPVEATAPEAPPPEPATLPTVLVASRDIGANVVLTTELTEWREWHKPLDPSIATITDAVPFDSIMSATTRRDIAAGEPVSWEDLVNPTGNPKTVTGLLKSGYRAMTVSVDEATTQAQIIYPGDHVDVILVHSPGTGGVPSEVEGGGGPAAQVILRDVRVLAVGSATIGTHNPKDWGDFHLAGVSEPLGRTYTLEVSPWDAERMALATVAGRLTLVLRPMSAGNTAAGSPYLDEAAMPVRFAEVMRGLGSSEDEIEPRPPLPRIRIIRGRRGASEETLMARENDASQEAAELLAEALRGG